MICDRCKKVSDITVAVRVAPLGTTAVVRELALCGPCFMPTLSDPAPVLGVFAQMPTPEKNQKKSK